MLRLVSLLVVLLLGTVPASADFWSSARDLFAAGAQKLMGGGSAPQVPFKPPSGPSSSGTYTGSTHAPCEKGFELDAHSFSCQPAGTGYSNHNTAPTRPAELNTAPTGPAKLNKDIIEDAKIPLPEPTKPANPANQPRMDTGISLLQPGSISYPSKPTTTYQEPPSTFPNPDATYDPMEAILNPSAPPALPPAPGGQPIPPNSNCADLQRQKQILLNQWNEARNNFAANPYVSQNWEARMARLQQLNAALANCR